MLVAASWVGKPHHPFCLLLVGLGGLGGGDQETLGLGGLGGQGARQALAALGSACGVAWGSGLLLVTDLLEQEELASAAASTPG